jgi:hypothetical protein
VDNSVNFNLETIDYEGEEVACLVRNDTHYIDLNSLNLFFELAARSSDAYEAVCQMVHAMLEMDDPNTLEA